MRGKSITKRLVDGLEGGGGECFVWDYVVKYRAGTGRGWRPAASEMGRCGNVAGRTRSPGKRGSQC
jgi:hypothetical protein